MLKTLVEHDLSCFLYQTLNSIRRPAAPDPNGCTLIKSNIYDLLINVYHSSDAMFALFLHSKCMIAFRK